VLFGRYLIVEESAKAAAKAVTALQILYPLVRGKLRYFYWLGLALNLINRGLSQARKIWTSLSSRDMSFDVAARWFVGNLQSRTSAARVVKPPNIIRPYNHFGDHSEDFRICSIGLGSDLSHSV